MHTALISRALQRRAWLLPCAWLTGWARTQTQDHSAFRAEAALRISITRYGGNGLAGLLISALVNQLLGTLTAAAHEIAAIAAQGLFSAGGPDRLLHVPRSPMYGGK